MKKLIQWLKPSFEGTDGKVSYRRLTAFLFCWIDAYIILTAKVNTEIMLNVHYSILAFILLLTGIITTQNILQFFKRNEN